ncbi:ABC transporter permease [Paenibacillus sp. GD4]|uniref:ABC transporter permease n=1 Tax=Paenibacillus sp. GD4 TaxID=3068890 RepID=UPI002796D474|nr:ABC transporter permease [Paenibacillus sp. GD4]MDQ1910351.1 ABC transporter permease [Paenibacillus sp. GD4]
MNPLKLWHHRSSLFMREILPYLKYALQSLSFSSILLIVLSSYVYDQLLGSIPPQFPTLLTASLLMLPVLAVTPILTYLQKPDIIFLLPREAELADYFRAAQRKAFWLQSLATAAGWLIVWRLIRMSDADIKSYFLLGLLMVIVLKKVLLHGKWLELHASEPRIRRILGAARWIMAGLLTYGLLKLPHLWGVLIVAGGSAVYLLAVSSLVRGERRLPWMNLIELARHHRTVLYRLLNLFIDVPSVQGRARRRPVPRRLPEWLGFRPNRAYLYLYVLVFLRSESFGILLRLTILGAVLAACSGGGVLGYVLWGFFAFITAVQLGELQRQYLHSERSYLYPLPEEQKLSSARTVRFLLHSLTLLILSAVLGAASGLWVNASILFILGAAVSYLYHRFRK